MNPTCPRCKSQQTVKNGSTAGATRRKCKACGYLYTKERLHGASQQQKLLGVLLYVHGLSMRTIGKLIGFSTPAVLHWIRDYARHYCPKPAACKAAVIELDEMWHFLQKKPKSSGYGKPTAEPQVVLLIGNAAVVMTPPSASSTSD